MPVRKEDPNYKYLIFEKLEEYEKTFEPMTIGEMLYSCLRLLKPNQVSVTKEEVMKITDKDFYSSFCQVFQKEVDLESNIKNQNNNE
jgi:hypothetical protein